jgi:hypothetical protein
MKRILGVLVSVKTINKIGVGLDYLVSMGHRLQHVLELKAIEKHGEIGASFVRRRSASH